MSLNLIIKIYNKASKKFIRNTILDIDEEYRLSDLFMALENKKRLITRADFNSLYYQFGDALYEKFFSEFNDPLIKEYLLTQNYHQVRDEIFSDNKDFVFIDISSLDYLSQLEIIKHKFTHSIKKETYYKIQDIIGADNLPYIETNTRILWNINCLEIRIVDFLKTHNIPGNSMEILYSPPHIEPIQQSAFLSADFIKIAWDNFYHYLDQTTAASGLFSKSEDSVYDLLKNKFQNITTPAAIFNFVLSKNEWRVPKLAKHLRMRSEDAESFLRGLHYSDDSHQDIFTKTAASNEVFNKLIQI